jgi:hypothetical protein
MLKLVFAKGSDGDLPARFADGSKTHDVLQCPSGPAG